MIKEGMNIQPMTLERAKELLESEGTFMCAVPCAPNYPAHITDIDEERITKLKVTVQYADGHMIGDKYRTLLKNVREEVIENINEDME